MFKLESYVTTILLGYIDKYVKDFKPSDAQVSLWGGGVALHNLVLKSDILQQEVHLPFIVSSGRIHELLIQVPWTKIMSESIIVTIDTIECVFAYDPNVLELQPQRSSHRSQLVEAPPGYMQALVRRIIMNISLRVHHVIIKYVHNSIILSLNVKHLSIDSAGSHWEPTFSDIDNKMPAIRKLVILDDLTLCLDNSNSDGKIRFYHEPLLYRCRIELRLLTRLMSATSGHANGVSVQFRTSKLAWGVTANQLHLLIRLLRTRDSDVKVSPSSPSPYIATVTVTEPTSLHTTTSEDCEPRESAVGWCKWAWSWLPSWTIRQDEVDVNCCLPGPIDSIPIYINVYSDEVSLVFKIIETEGGSRKRTRGVFVLSILYAAIKCYVLTPTMLSIKAGARDVILKSQGNCICGQVNINAEPTIYMSGMQTKTDGDMWKWPDENNTDMMETIVSEECNVPGSKSGTNFLVEELNEESSSREWFTHDKPKVDTDAFWQKMEPLIYMEYWHKKYPEYNKSYDNSRTDIRYNNWQEECQFNIQLRPIWLRLSVGLFHRVSALRRILNEYLTLHRDIHLRTLTLEECEALHENTPQCRIYINMQDFRLCMHPWDHSDAEKSIKTPLVLNIVIPKATILISRPLDSHKVCLAAIQMKEESGALWQATRLHVSVDLESIEATICSSSHEHSKSCARANIRIVTHSLLNRQILKREESVNFSYSVKIRDASIFGSASRLQAAWQIPMSLLNEKLSTVLRYTTLATDALNDDGSVSLDITLETLAMRGYITTNVNSHIVTLQSCRITASRLSDDGILKKAWIFSAPDVPSTVPYLRAAVQWCYETSPTTLDYAGVWTEPTALSMDPLLIAWLSYKPQFTRTTDFNLKEPLPRTMSQHLPGRSYIAISQSAPKVHGTDSEVELLPHSVKSSTNLCEEPNQQQKYKTTKFKDDALIDNDLLKLYERLQHMLITVELGLVLAYVTMSTVSMADCGTVRLAMEQHVASSQRVLALSVGRWSMHSSTLSKQLWQDIKHDGPTFITDQALNAIESFPWKIRFADVSCYTMETQTGPHPSGRERATGLRSQLKTTHVIQLRSILELVTTSVTMSMVTKYRHYRTFLKKPSRKKQNEPEKKEDKTKYFTSGASFKPTTLKEFVRGPVRRNKSPADVTDESAKTSDSEPDQKITTGPIVSIGVNLLADTTPIIVRLDQYQVHMVAATIHCFVHVLTLCQHGPLIIPKTQDMCSSQSLGASKSITRPLCETDEQVFERTDSECESELIPIFQAQPDQERKSNITKFLWFQWVIGNGTVTVSADDVKLVFDIENIVSSIDVQEHYNQLKVNIASASLRYFNRTESNEWIPGVLNGRVIELRETITDRDDKHFLAVTITQAQISDLPPSWKEELNPKLFEEPDAMDSVWEIYATLAQLEVAIQPSIFEKIISVAFEMAPRSFCPLTTETKRRSTWQWPFCYINGGGLRLIVACNYQDTAIERDDTFIITCDRISVHPHPENPICRHLVNTYTKNVVGGLEGRQYEILVLNITIRTTQFARLIYEEESGPNILKFGGELPAHKMSQTVSLAVFTPVISLLDVSCVLAPALFVGSVLVYAPGVELNIVSNCVIELNIDQLMLIRLINVEMSHAFRKRQYSCTDFHDKSGVCPYATLLITEVHTADISKGDINGSEEDPKLYPVTSHLSPNDARPATKKTASVTYLGMEPNLKEYIEVFITMGTIEVSLYALDDNSPEIIALRPQEDASSEPEENDKMNSTNLDAKLQLFHIMLQQPNLYYVHNRTQKNFHVSLFNAWISLDAIDPEKCWHSVIMCTAQGVIDPVTDIPPALATMKVSVPASAGSMCMGANAPGTLNLDIDRPLLFEICANRLKRLKIIFELLQGKLSSQPSSTAEFEKLPILYLVRLFMGQNSIGTATIQTSQVGMNGYEGCAGWDSASLQLAWAPRQDRVVARSLLSAAVVSAGAPHDARHSVLQPLQVGAIPAGSAIKVCKVEDLEGVVKLAFCLPIQHFCGVKENSFELNATWEAWRPTEGSASREPTVSLRIDLDRIIIDVRPDDLSALKRLQQTLLILFGKNNQSPSVHSNSTGSSITQHHDSSHCNISSTNIDTDPSVSSFKTDDMDHYYKDDLRSSAFKVVRGDQLPMAYEVVLHREVASWAYPHPRGIAKLIAFPLKEHNEVVDCILEMYNQKLNNWEPHTYFNLPVYESSEFNVYVPPPEAAFATMWRFRFCANVPHKTNYKFCMTNFMPRQEPLLTLSDLQPEAETEMGNTGITAVQLLSAVHVDSYFAPQLLPRLSFSLQLTALELHVHNSMPFNTSQATPLEGYYLSKPLMRSHRVYTMNAQGTTMHGELGSPGALFLINANFSNDILDCASGTMEPLLSEFRVQMAMSLNNKPVAKPRFRFRTSRVLLAMDVPRLLTLHALAADWKPTLKQFECESSSQSKLLSNVGSDDEKMRGKEELADVIMGTLEGRVSLWLRNSCVCALRVAQEGTEEVIPLESGTRLAYRWRNPSATRKLRFAFANPSADWHWSSSIPFSTGSYRVLLEDMDCLGGKYDMPGSGVFLHVDVTQTGSIRCMHLSGRLLIANMLRFGLLYKVRLHSAESKTWRTVSSGELATECVGRSIVCGSNCEMVLKIKNMNHNFGWSGDIPLKECPKENIPWLVKVPNEGDVPKLSVWCRVVCARSDGRVLASIWPLYVLYSHLPLDTDVLIVSEMDLSPSDLPSEDVLPPPPLIQTASGRGNNTQLLAPGTTLHRHSLSFQYRNIECPVTREAVPLHYGVTDTSVFDNSPSVYNIDEVLQEVIGWLDRSRIGTETGWPYSLVTKHWLGVWHSAQLQPRCDVTVRYQAVRAGGGCSLEMHLSPVVLLCNASPIALTLRAHDATPLCKLETGAAIAPPSAMLTKPFYMSVEMGRETFISNQLEVCTEVLKSYDAKFTGQVALNHPTTFAIQCNQKMALFTMYYEIKNEINVLGVTSTYSLINMLDTNILVSAIAVAGDDKKDVLLHPKFFKVFQPTKGKCQGAPLCRFWLRERWRGSDPGLLHTFLCLSLPAGASACPAHTPVPVRLGRAPMRRSLGLSDCNKKSIAIVINQHKEDGRWHITVAPDTCPQYVVHNQTCNSLAIAQPMIQCNDVASASYTTAVSDCAGARWWNVVEPHSVLHYSSPAHCKRSTVSPGAYDAEPLLTFSRIIDDSEPDWCLPVAAIDGEQLVQLCRGVAVKMRVRSHPHSSLVELQNVEQKIPDKDIDNRKLYRVCAEGNLEELMRCEIAGVSVTMSVSGDTCPLLALHMDTIAVHVSSHATKTKTTLSVKDIQIDNGQYESHEFAFAVVVTTHPHSVEPDRWPALRNMFAPQDCFTAHQSRARVLVNMYQEKWTAVAYNFNELTEIDVRIGPLALYLEEAYLRAVLELFRLAIFRAFKPLAANNCLSLERPLCLRTLHIHPLDLNLTLQTAKRVYIALDHSSLHLSSFMMKNMMMSTELLTHELTVHYLSAALLGAEWVVGGLELLGAPGTLAARVMSSSNSVRDVTSATAAALVRSLSSWAESLAFNLDLLSGEDNHVKRSRSRAPSTFMAGVATRIINLVVNVLGSVGALPLHPFIGDAAVDADNRGFLDALTKPLRATAELVAFTGQGLLKQTGWDHIRQPQPLSLWSQEEFEPACWRRNCVRWTFRLAEMTLLAGFEVLLNNAHLQLLLTHKFIVLADPESERVVEMIDLRCCTLCPYQGTIIELHVTQRRLSKVTESRSVEEDDEYQMSSAAMARLPRLTGEDSPGGAQSRVLLLPAPGQSPALHAALAAAIHYNSDTHFALL